MRAFDGFCGDGGMTDAMLAAGFQVVGADIVRRPAYRGQLIQKDIRELEAEEVGPVVWAHGSPPCGRFSLARPTRKADPPTDADLDLLRVWLQLRNRLKPRFWSVENVRGSLRWFKPLLGEPRLRHGPYFFWGNFPPFIVERAGLNKGLLGGSRSPTRGQSHRTRDPWLRARLPFELVGPMARAAATEISGGQEK